MSRIRAMHKWESFESRIKEAMGASIEQDFFKSILHTKNKTHTNLPASPKSSRVPLIDAIVHAVVEYM